MAELQGRTLSAASFECPDDGANRFIEKHFHDCVYSAQDLCGFSLGMGSILLWLTAQLPQVSAGICQLVQLCREGEACLNASPCPCSGHAPRALVCRSVMLSLLSFVCAVSAGCC